MKVILSHVNLDFDALASMIAAKKLYPDAQMVITDKLNGAVKQFLAIYRDSIDMKQDHLIDWSTVDHIILVDVASLKRIGSFIDKLRPDVTYTLYDHHPPTEDSVSYIDGKVEEIGATITMLVEELQKKHIEITSFEATVFGLGVYTDTGAFTYSSTTARDLKIASFLLEKGMKLELVNRFSEQIDSNEQNTIFNQLLMNASESYIDGLNIVISTYKQKKFQGGLATLTRKLVETTGADAAIAVVEMQKRVYIVGRANSDRVNFLPLMKMYGGGGHEKAASATIKNGILDEIVVTVNDIINQLLKPAITAKAIMVSPVKSIPPTITIDAAADLMYRYGHTGFPVVTDGQLLGIISRRDIDKATHHGLGHAPVKAYMSSNVVTIEPDTSLEEIQNTMIKHDIGRLPVVSDGKIIGILSRTNVIEVLHNEHIKKELEQSALLSKESNVRDKMEKQLPVDVNYLLLQIGKSADEASVNAFMIGGIVRDIILDRENDDIDIVIEGDGIQFAKTLADQYGGEVKIHETFGTSTWKHPSGTKIDITSSRFEYYDHPAALPTVEHSNLRQDLYRRDFTMNAMAIQLNEKNFGNIIDFFNGREDLANKKIKILHNLSFIEDPTRVLRAVRFETRFGFKMDMQTLELATTSMNNMKNLSKTRISNELHKLFTEQSPLRGLQRLFEIEFWDTIIDPFSGETVVMAHAKKLDAFLNGEFEFIRNQDHSWFLYMILPFYKHENWLRLVTPFALKRKEVKLAEEIHDLTEMSAAIEKHTVSSFHLHFKNISDEALLFFISHPDYEDIYHVGLNYLLERKSIPPLLNGEDLKVIGIKPGPIFSNLLLEIELLYLDKKIQTREQALSWLQEDISLKY